MRTTIYLAIGVLICIALIEIAWRVRHGSPTTSIGAEYGNYVAQFRSLPESDKHAPYGSGIFIKHKLNPLWFTSELAFAGYCNSDKMISWESPSDLKVVCIPTEGMPVVIGHYAITIKFN